MSKKKKHQIENKVALPLPPAPPAINISPPSNNIDEELKKLKSVSPPKEKRNLKITQKDLIYIGLMILCVLLGLMLSPVFYKPESEIIYKNNTCNINNASSDTITTLSSIYKMGRQGKIIINVKANYNPRCDVNIYYPNATLWRNRNLTRIDNNVFVYNFTVPNTTGFYPYVTNCMYKNFTLEGSGEFKVE